MQSCHVEMLEINIVEIISISIIQEQWCWIVFDDSQDWWNYCTICRLTGNDCFLIYLDTAIRMLHN